MNDDQDDLIGRGLTIMESSSSGNEVDESLPVSIKPEEPVLLDRYVSASESSKSKETEKS
jgi:hypothetical protein